MHHGRHRRHGFRPPLGARWYSSDNVLPRLEEYRRDLEEELADVSDLIRRLQQEGPQGQPEPQSV